MKTEKCPVTFVNTLAVSGFNNGVINLAFTTAQFVPQEDDGKVVVVLDEFVSANLRMDLLCAQQVHEALGKIIEQNTKPAGLAN